MSLSASEPEIGARTGHLSPPVPRGAPALLSLIWRFSTRQPVGAFSGILLALILLGALFANVLAPYDPIKNNVGAALIGPAAHNILGTDQYGRDVFSRIVFGARTSLYVGTGATLLAVAIAIIVGGASGYFGGMVDYVVQRFVDTAQAIPPLIFLIGVMLILGQGSLHVVLALGFVTGLGQSRIIRGSVMSLKTAQYIEASKASGATNVRILLWHIFPNIIPLAIVLGSITIGGMIVAEASLSFLGFGIPPPNPSWGGMMSSDGRTYMIVAPWLLIAPTVALSLVVFATNMFGDAIRDELDPRMRGAK